MYCTGCTVPKFRQCSFCAYKLPPVRYVGITTRMLFDVCMRCCLHCHGQAWQRRASRVAVSSSGRNGPSCDHMRDIRTIVSNCAHRTITQLLRLAAEAPVDLEPGVVPTLLVHDAQDSLLDARHVGLACKSNCCLSTRMQHPSRVVWCVHVCRGMFVHATSC